MAVAGVDRAAAVRQALRALVAEHGFHGASMSAVAAEAGVATGTAYTHYASKDELVLAAYLETKAELARRRPPASTARPAPAERFRAIWLADLPPPRRQPRPRAASCCRSTARPTGPRRTTAALDRGGDPLLEQAATPDIAARLLPLPLEVLYELGLAPAVRLAAAAIELGDDELDAVAEACWRAVTRPAPRHRRRVALASVPRRHGRIANGARGIEMEGTSPRRKSGVRIFGTDANRRSP